MGDLTHKSLDAVRRLAIFRELSGKFSLIRMVGKHPIEKGWVASCRTRREFAEIGFKGGENAGIATGPASGILALDIDDLETFSKVALEKGWKIQPTYVVRTGGGNFHFYFHYPQDGKRYGNKSFKNLGFDIRGDGGVIVAPGSIHPETGKPYAVAVDAPIAPPPEWLLDLIEGSSEGNPGRAAITGDEVIPEGERNSVLVGMAGAMRRRGMNMEEIAAGLHKVNEGRCDPPLERGEVVQIARSVSKYKPQQSPAPAVGLQGTARSSEKIQDLVQVLTDACGIEDFREIELPKRKWLIEPLIYEGQLGMIFAAPGIGKTWLALALGIGVSSGGKIFGPYSAPEAKGVIYVDGEMPAAELQERIDSFWLELSPALFKVVSSEWLALKEEPPLNIADADWRQAIYEFMKGNGKFRLLILDNLSSLAPGCDESSREDWDPINQWLLELRRVGVTVILIHHAGKSGDQRGTSAREDQLDFILKLTSKSKSPSFRVDFKKARSLFQNHRHPFELDLKKNSEQKLELAYKPIQEDLLHQVAALASKGLNQTEIAERLLIVQGTVSKKIKKAREQGLLTTENRLADRGEQGREATSPEDV